MPSIRRRQQRLRDLTRDGLMQLRWGFDHSGQRFDRVNVSARRRHGASDCCPQDMPLVEATWHSHREALLETVDDPWKLWAYRRFELNVEPIFVDRAIPAVPPKPEALVTGH